MGHPGASQYLATLGRTEPLIQTGLHTRSEQEIVSEVRRLRVAGHCRILTRQASRS